MSKRVLAGLVTEQAEAIDPATLLEFAADYRAEILSAVRLPDGRLWLQKTDCEVIWPVGGVAEVCAGMCDTLLGFSAAADTRAAA